MSREQTREGVPTQLDSDSTKSQNHQPSNKPHGGIAAVICTSTNKFGRAISACTHALVGLFSPSIHALYTSLNSGASFISFNQTMHVNNRSFVVPARSNSASHFASVSIVCSLTVSELAPTCPLKYATPLWMTIWLMRGSSRPSLLISLAGPARTTLVGLRPPKGELGRPPERRARDGTRTCAARFISRGMTTRLIVRFGFGLLQTTRRSTRRRRPRTDPDHSRLKRRCRRKSRV